jgi:hypothetical protein
MLWLHDHDEQQFAQLSLAVPNSAVIRSVGNAPCIMGFWAQIYFQIPTCANPSSRQLDQTARVASAEERQSAHRVD